MPRYAIKVVPHDWQESLPLPFHKTSRDYSKIEPEMHILVYQQTVGIIGDTVVTTLFLTAREWADQNTGSLPNALADADYLLPFDALYYRGKVIPPQAVRDILSDPTFPRLDGWRPISAEIHHQFIRHLI